MVETACENVSRAPFSLQVLLRAVTAQYERRVDLEIYM